MTIEFRESTGDVFRDLGFDSGEAQELRLRSDLMIRVQDIVRKLPGSQAQIAQQLGTTQPRVSDLLRGKLHLFSLDFLAQILTRLGAHVSVYVDDFALGGLGVQSAPAWTAECASPGSKVRIHAQKPQVAAADSQLALAA